MSIEGSEAAVAIPKSVLEVLGGNVVMTMSVVNMSKASFAAAQSADDDDPVTV
eukprot:CAMPEP_0180802936 /NCGR_PEP_ID=MMETSP1038_2-20121128/60614_1 /TAXON_ID=632150 /ORGANISM="Azadinium spinosum, Strain 3D9" /LENGTH=52 /DNA_ID=CAMNT_0022843187 /DNA_START=42 /DNA_END=197 /DNA_ORIENTATION=-